MEKLTISIGGPQARSQFRASLCPNCGYAVGDLTACPECGGWVEDAIHAYTIEQATKLHRGVAVAEFATIFSMFGALPAKIALGGTGSMTGLDAGSQRMLVSIYELGIACALGIGWWLFSFPHPVQRTGRSNRWRIALRAVIMAKLFVALGACFLTIGARWLPPRPSILESAVNWAGMISTVAVAIGAILYIQAIAVRLGRPDLRHHARTRLYLFAWLAVFASAGAGVVLFPGVLNSMLLKVARMLLLLPVSLGALVWYIMYIGYVDSARRMALGLLVKHWRAQENVAVHLPPRDAG